MEELKKHNSATMELTDIKTFKDLCYYKSLYTNDLVRKYPGCRELKEGEKGLNYFTGEDKYLWIEKIIHSYNSLGFCVGGPQPGSLKEINVYTSHYDYMTKSDNFLQGNYKLGQRAMINGFMLESHAIKIYNIMKQNPNYIVSLSCYDNDIPEEFNCCSLTFKDDIPMYAELKEQDKFLSSDHCMKDNCDFDELYKKIPNIHFRGFGNITKIDNLFRMLNYEYLPNLDSSLFENNVIVLISIMDKRWNYNDDLWIDLYKCLFYNQ